MGPAASGESANPPHLTYGADENPGVEDRAGGGGGGDGRVESHHLVAVGGASGIVGSGSDGGAMVLEARDVARRVVDAEEHLDFAGERRGPARSEDYLDDAAGRVSRRQIGEGWERDWGRRRRCEGRRPVLRFRLRSRIWFRVSVFDLREIRVWVLGFFGERMKFIRGEEDDVAKSLGRAATGEGESTGFLR